eukprot:GHVL01030368.1.p1 GENE.GHVL01030368.1~~GHVL01030368.1.p1  ORF type:complete len:164 (+),score=19.49 GHVL01030368.1:130-621(+)
MPSGTTKQPPQPATCYPLGGSLFASVKTWRGAVKIHIRHYAVPTRTKGGRVVPTQRGVTLDLKKFQKLLRVQKKLKEDFHQQVSSLSPTEEKQEEKHPKNHTECPPSDYYCSTPSTTATASTQSEKYPQQLQRPLYSTCPAYCPATTVNPLPVTPRSGYEVDN